MLISPETWRRLLKPRMATFISTLKSINPGVKIAYHSDGHILPIIPDLIEIGLDVLNPVQPRSIHVQLDTPLENFWAMVNTITHTPYSSL